VFCHLAPVFDSHHPLEYFETDKMAASTATGDNGMSRLTTIPLEVLLQITSNL
jgi:hypothetical protein